MIGVVKDGVHRWEILGDGFYPTCTVSIEIDPPSTPSTGKEMASLSCLVAIT
jgi:hypothetical protein